MAAVVGVVLVGIVLLVAHAADAPNRNPASTSPEKVLVFKTTPQGELKLHFYFPRDWSPRDKRPALVFWHGGVFQSGSPRQFYAKAEYFASRGLVCASAEYRLKNTHGTLIDKCAEDARSAMRWIKGHATEIGIDPEKVIASGGSAGGTLALLVAREKGPDAKDDDVRISPRPCATILFNPAIGELETFIVGRVAEEPALVYAQVAALNTPEKNEPPAIFFFGTEDRQFLEVSREFCRKAEAQGSRGELWTAEKMGHGFFNRPPWHEATVRKADEFLGSLGYLKGPPEIKASLAAVLKRELPSGGR
ncbi:MAG: alpha/beta hydrolase [Verrucomicrobia bacterium]|nr:alpha/beta hydrolase [Verrucomicrobiota bacterium]